MSVGQQTNSSTIDATLTSLAIRIRELMDAAQNLNTLVSSGGNVLAFLESIGYSAADAATAQTLIGYINNLQGVYHGTATVAAPFNFDNALSPLWAGQV